MGFRNPFRDPGRRERRRLHHRLLAGRQHAAALPRPGRHRPLRDRAQAVQLRLADVLQARPAVLPVELPRVRARHHHGGHPAAQPAEAARLRRPDPAQRLALEHRGRPERWSPACETSRRSPTRTSGTRTATTTPRPLLGTPCLGRTRRHRARSRPARPPSARGCSRSCTPAASARTAWRSTTSTPANPNPKKFPPYYDNSVILGEFGAGHAARGQARRAGQASSRSTASWTAAAVQRRRHRHVPFECDNPMDMQFGADGAFYLLTYGNGFLRRQPGRRHVQVGVRQGPARAEGRADRRQDRRRRRR